MENPEIEALPKARALVLIGAAVVLALWLASFIPVIEHWNNLRAKGFHLIPAFWASITLLPLGLSALAGGLSGREKGIRRARRHLVAAAILLGMVALLEVFQRLVILWES